MPGTKDTSISFGEEHGDAPAERSELVAVGVRESVDEALASEAAQIVGGLACGVGLVEQGGHERGELAVVEATDEVAEPDDGRQRF